MMSFRMLYDEHRDVIWSIIPMCKDERWLFALDEI